MSKPPLCSGFTTTDCQRSASQAGAELMVSEVLRKSPSAEKRLFGKKNGISMGYGDFTIR